MYARFAVFAAVMSLAAFYFGWEAYAEDRLLDKAPTTSATLVEAVDNRWDEDYLELDVHLPGGATVRVQTARFEAHPAKGEAMQVQYAWRGEELLARQAGIRPDRDQWIWAALGAGMAVAAVVVLRARRRADRQHSPTSRTDGDTP
ncbi:hypothetical protein HPO96_17865 [Kribbella sandramycini]|uniref:DUF3592 domain-containing protein n=1 Tax=Kribbella sandramycini TaxID=60450 RepID=A0A7Y4L0K4_9ACTN|nr:hypothetical protein [Kribbella sandramycini]MBB6565851.1 hypothetical protein [Kribbella sandramycini]NOL42115.1 hypothetical protein [Kribbella sandramycini]